ncbi:unnamed protein product [Camellia sinensis]
MFGCVVWCLRDEEYHEIKEVQSNRRLKYKAVMEENTLINSSACIVSGSEGENLGDYRSSEEAALIVSKRNMACQVDTRDYYAVRVPKKEDNTRVMTLEEYETHLGKRKARQTLEPEGRGKVIRKVSCLCHTNQAVHDDSWCGPIEEGQYIKIGKAIAVLTDREDFERIYNWRVVEDEFSEFSAKLESCKCDPLVAVAEEKVKVDQFSTLREHDLCVRIQQYQSSADEEFFMQHQSSGDEEFFMQYQTSAEEEFSMLDDISPEDIASALEVFRNYDKPLKEDCKTQLTLELTHEKSCRILDTLVLEALWGVNIKEIEKNLPKTSDVFLSDDVKTACSVLADGIIVGLYEYLAPMKASALKDFEKAVIFPLSDVCFGPCTDELTEVINLRLLIMREECKRILNDRGLNCLGGFPLKLSSFSIYKLSRDAATTLGEYYESFCFKWRKLDLSGDKDVGLEHLVLAIFFGKQESDRTGMAAQEDCTSLFLDEDKWDDELLKCLRNSNTECGVESFDDSEAFKSLLPEDCLDAAGRPYSCGFFIMEELHKTFECGLELNAIRE